MAMSASPGNDPSSVSGIFTTDLHRVEGIKFHADRATQFSYGRPPPGIKQYAPALHRATKRHAHLPGLAIANPGTLRTTLQNAAKITRGQADDAIRWLYNVGVFIEAVLLNGETAILFDAERLERIAAGERLQDPFERRLRQRAQALAEDCLQRLTQEPSPNSGERNAAEGSAVEEAVVVLMDHVQEIPRTGIEDAVYQPIQILESESRINGGEARALLTQATERGLLHPIGTSGTWFVFADSEEAASDLSRAITSRQEELDRTNHSLAETVVQCDREFDQALQEHAETREERHSNKVSTIRIQYDTFRFEAEREIHAERDRQLEVLQKEYERRVGEIETDASRLLEKSLSAINADGDRTTAAAEQQLRTQCEEEETSLRADHDNRKEQRQQPLIRRIEELGRELEELRRV